MNIIDYIKLHANETFKEFNFTEVDNLILSVLPYLNFTKIIPPFTNKKITLQEAYQKLKDKKEKNRGGFIGNSYKMLALMSTTKRYQNLILYNYMSVINDEMQFGALTFLLDDKSVFVSFSGTDSSIIGWEEDFKMAYMYPGASQKYAAIYLNKTIRLTDRYVRVGGHSKGGNLAICATMNAKFYIKRKVKEIYNNDGPGFLKKEVESKNYQKIKSKIKMFVPENSIIGMILYHTDNYTVVSAKSFNIFQHDAFNWRCNSTNFIKSKQSSRSKNLEQRITKKLEELSIDERLKLTKDIFSIFKDNNIKDTKEIKIKKLLDIIKSFNKLDKETKNLLLELLYILFIK